MSAAPCLQRGETLIGLLIGMTVGMLALSAGADMLTQLLRGQRLALQDSHVQQDLHFALDLMTSELQDAQYAASAWRSRSPASCTDAFCDGAEDFSLGSERMDWTLDRNHDGQQDNNECTGYRLRSGALQVRTACAPEVWVALTDTSTLRLTQLQASAQCTVRAGWLYRQVLLQIEGSSPLEPARRIGLQRRIAIRNPLPQAVQARYCP